MADLTPVMFSLTSPIPDTVTHDVRKSGYPKIKERKQLEGLFLRGIFVLAVLLQLAGGEVLQGDQQGDTSLLL